MVTRQGKTYASALAFRASLDERARRRQRDTGESLQLVRRRYAFEAFLRRVPRSGQPLVLKGGYLMQLRYAEGTRLTKDLDTALRDQSLSTQPPEIIALRLQAALRAVAEVPDVDFFSFDISEPRQDLGADREFVGYRFSVLARVDSREFDTFQLDCTSGDALVMPLEKAQVGALFAFAGLEATTIDAISSAQHVAEKLHAICRDRGTRVNNRVKDLFDVVLFLSRGVTPEQVAGAIGEVFKHAGDTQLARLEQEVPIGWRSEYDGFASENHLNVSFDRACELHRELCRSVLQHVR